MENLTPGEEITLLTNALVWNRILMDNIYHSNGQIMINAYIKHSALSEKYTSNTPCADDSSPINNETVKCETEQDIPTENIYVNDNDIVTLKEKRISVNEEKENEEEEETGPVTEE
jgi:hypothetical protein